MQTLPSRRWGSKRTAWRIPRGEKAKENGRRRSGLGPHFGVRARSSGAFRSAVCCSSSNSDEKSVKSKPSKPSFELNAEDLLEIQLEYLKSNNKPYVDHGIEVLYRFADIDPFEIRCRYFGNSMDLGQFERFRRMLHTHQYRALLNHKDAKQLSLLKLSDHKIKSRYLVEGFRTGEKGTFEWTLIQVNTIHHTYDRWGHRVWLFVRLAFYLQQ